jgi:hypothetical protein
VRVSTQYYTQLHELYEILKQSLLHVTGVILIGASNCVKFEIVYIEKSAIIMYRLILYDAVNRNKVSIHELPLISFFYMNVTC